MQSKQYWEQRTVDRLVKAENIGNTASGTIWGIYNQAQANIQVEIDSIYANYAKKGILDKSELQRALLPKEKESFLKKIKVKASKLGINIKDVYDERYLSRLSRLNAIKEQIKWEVYQIASKEQNISSRAYNKIIDTTYEKTQKDIQNAGISPSFATLDKSVSIAILNSKWVGGNFSTRIWGNVDNLAKELPTIIGGALTSGTSIQKTARLVRDRFDVSKNDATRLVRTESNYFANQSELQSYIDDGYTQYEFMAILDGRTSTICRAHDGNVYDIDKAVTGFNYPPLHANCRSTTVVVLNSDKLKTGTKSRTGRLIDGKTGEQAKNDFVNSIIDN